jgi:signal transduction histidine kinase
MPERPRELIRTALREPFTPRARRELLFCAIGALYSQIAFALIGLMLYPGTAFTLIRAIPIVCAVLALGVVTGLARKLGNAFRGLAARLLGEHVPAPPRMPTSGRSSVPIGARLRDGVSWRAVLYGVLRVPVGLLDLYALSYWAGVIAITYPFWWRLFRNHAPGVQLGPVDVITPFGAFGVRTFPGALVVSIAGVALVLLAPWVTRGMIWVDRWLIRSLLGPGKLSSRLRHLEESRAQAVGDAATTLRRIERDLHDGTQAQLATLAMKLGQAKEKLEHGSEVPFDPSGALDLVDDAHRQAKEALIELRDIARGIHPPALDVGLDAALATLVARSPVPTTLEVDLAMRPTLPIETIAYFSTAELLANVAKHSRARRASVTVRTMDGRVRLEVADDGMGGARVGAGSGLSGLADRVGAVDGDLRIVSPRGGPTTVRVELPARA